MSRKHTTPKPLTGRTARRHRGMIPDRSAKLGAPPGQLTAPEDATPSRVSIVSYSGDTLREEVVDDLAHVERARGDQAVLWVDVVGLADAESIRRLGEIFIPLSFLAGVYGMNFDEMPGLHQPWGYPVLLLFMAAVAGGLLYYFRSRGWIGGRRPRERTGRDQGLQ